MTFSAKELAALRRALAVAAAPDVARTEIDGMSDESLRGLALPAFPTLIPALDAMVAGEQGGMGARRKQRERDTEAPTRRGGVKKDDLGEELFDLLRIAERAANRQGAHDGHPPRKMRTDEESVFAEAVAAGRYREARSRIKEEPAPAAANGCSCFCDANGDDP